MAGIKWDSYLQSAVSDISRQLNLEIKTRRVEESRLSKAASILSQLNLFSKIYVNGCLALIPIRIAADEHVALYSWSADPKESVRHAALAARLGLPEPVEDISDVLFLFLASKFKLRTAPDLPKPLGEFIGLQETTDGHTADFDGVRNAHGNLLIWKLPANFDWEAVFALLTTDNVGQKTLRYTLNSSPLAAILAKGPSQVVNLADVCRSLINPVLEATGIVRVEATVAIGATSLTRALEIEISRMDVAYCVGGGACFSFRSKNRPFLALSIKNSPGFAKESILALVADKFNFKYISWDNEHLVAFLSQLEGSVQVISPPSSEGSRWLDERVFIDNNFKSSSEIDLVRSAYEEVLIFDAQDLEIFPLKVLAELAVSFAWARSPFVPAAIIPVAKKLLGIEGFPFENLYLSLSASHWKHCFIEIYRVVEGLYYFAWMHKLRNTLSSQLSEYDLLKTCQDTLSWKFDEKTSILNLFELIPAKEFSVSPNEIECLKEILDESSGMMRKFGGAIYSIRNSNIHQAEIEGKRINVTADCWPKLTLCLFELVRYFYRQHHAGMPKGRLTRIIDSSAQ